MKCKLPKKSYFDSQLQDDYLTTFSSIVYYKEFSCLIHVISKKTKIFIHIKLKYFFALLILFANLHVKNKQKKMFC